MPQSHDDLVGEFARWMAVQAGGDATTAVLKALTPGALSHLWTGYIDELVDRAEPLPAGVVAAGLADRTGHDQAILDLIAALAGPGRQAAISRPVGTRGHGGVDSAPADRATRPSLSPGAGTSMGRIGCVGGDVPHGWCPHPGVCADRPFE